MQTQRFLITGGSQGIGAALVAQARAAGHKVVFTGRKEAETAAVAKTTAALSVARSTTNTAEGLSRFHNLFVLRELLLLMTGTGHRLVVDPFPCNDCLVAEDDLMIISDKVSTPSHETRVAVASNHCLKQDRKSVV